MRITVSALLIVTVGITGCTRLFGPSSNDPGRNDQPVISQTPTAQDLVTYLNREAAKVQTLESRDVYIKADAPGEIIPGMSGVLVCQSPRNFRLTGAVARIDQIDFGSNDDLFWFWMKPDPNHSVYYCKYDDYNQGVKLPFPFQPEWVLQALAMAKYDTTKDYKVEVKKDTFELIDNTTVQGQAVKKVTVFSRRELRSGDPQVRSHIIMDAKTGTVIATADIVRVKWASYRTTDNKEVFVAYPQEIVMKWPSEKVTMRLVLNDVSVNRPLRQEDAKNIFTMLQLPNTPKVNLAQGTRTNPTGRTIEQAGGTRRP